MSASDRAADYLAAYRRRSAVPAERRARNIAAIRRRVAAAEEPRAERTSAVPHPISRAASFVFVAKSASLSVLLGVVGLGTIKLGASLLSGPVPAATVEPETPRLRADDAAQQVSSPRSGAQRAAAAPPPAVPPVPSVPVTPPIAEAATPNGVATTSRPVAGGTTASVAVPQPDTLRAEVELMRRVANAIERQQWVTALNLTAQHQQAFPKGAMTEERNAWRAVAKCYLGKTDGSVAATAFEAAYPGSALVAKVRQACGSETSKKKSTESDAR